MSFWSWLIANSATLQFVVSAALSLMTILVLIVTWTAIKKQADATVAQVEAARKQVELLQYQIEQSTAPLLVITWGKPGSPETHRIVNQGPGIAFQIFYWEGGFEFKDKGVKIEWVEPSTLGPGQSAPIAVSGICDALTVRCKGVDRNQRWSVFYCSSQKPQQHIVERGLQEVFLS
jgi:hypothetical protein